MTPISCILGGSMWVENFEVNVQVQFLRSGPQNVLENVNNGHVVHQKHIALQSGTEYNIAIM